MSAQQQTDAHRLSSYMSTLNTLMDEEKALISESFHQSEAQGY